MAANLSSFFLFEFAKLIIPYQNIAMIQFDGSAQIKDLPIDDLSVAIKSSTQKFFYAVSSKGNVYQCSISKHGDIDTSLSDKVDLTNLYLLDGNFNDSFECTSLQKKWVKIN